jgi:hypothetical protein
MENQNYSLAWQQLRTAMPLPEKELRSHLARCHHFAAGEVKDLRGQEGKVWEWLRDQAVNPRKIYQWLSQKYPTDYSKNYCQDRFEKRFRKVMEIKSALNALLPEVTDEQLRCMTYRVLRHNYGRIKRLTTDEHVIQDYLLRIGLNANTLYRWFCESRLPEDVKSQLVSGKIKASQALLISKNRERQYQVSLGWQIIEQGRQLVMEVF